MPLNKSQKKEYAYFQLVENENDLLGMIAYSKYKKSKIEYIEKYYKDNGYYPDDEQLKEYQKQQCLDTNKSIYRDSSESLLNAYLTLYVEDNFKELKERNSELNSKDEILKKKESDLNKKEEKLKKKISSFEAKKQNQKKEHGFFYGVLQSIVASFIILLITVCILVSSNFKQNLAQDISDTISNKTKVEMGPQ